MITEKDLLEAIAECQGQRNPNANTCIKLAAYYTILQNITGSAQPDPDPIPTYSYAGPPIGNTINYEGDSEFLQLVNGRDQDEILPVIDELMTTLQVINPRLYKSVIRKL